MRTVRCQSLPPQSTLAGLIGEAKALADLCLRATGSAPPTMIAIAPRGLLVHQPASLRNEEDKDRFATECRLVLTASEATIYAMVLESWMTYIPNGVLTELPPSKSTHRIEVLTIAAESRNERRFLMFPIKCKGQGIYAGMGEDTAPVGVTAQGRFTGLMRAKQNRADVETAQIYLIALGIRLGGPEHPFWKN